MCRILHNCRDRREFIAFFFLVRTFYSIHHVLRNYNLRVGVLEAFAVRLSSLLRGVRKSEA